MIKSTNIIHRLKEVNSEIQNLVLLMAPFYAALDLIQEGVPDEDVSCLESIPSFYVKFKRRGELEQERDKLMIRLALAFEQCPVEDPFV